MVVIRVPSVECSPVLHIHPICWSRKLSLRPLQMSLRYMQIRECFNNISNIFLFLSKYLTLLSTKQEGSRGPTLDGFGETCRPGNEPGPPCVKGKQRVKILPAAFTFTGTVIPLQKAHVQWKYLTRLQ